MPSLYANIVSGNATIPSNNNTSLYNPGGGNVVPVNGNVNANNVNVSNNVNVGGQISAVGDIITDGFFVGNGSQLTGIVSSYGNANVAVFLPTYTGNLAGNNITLTGQALVTGNITTGGYYFGDGSQLTNLPESNYSNANVAAFLPIYSGNISAGNVTVADAVTGATLSASQTISATGDISTDGNLRTLGAQGNIVGANYVTAGYFVGDGSLLTNVVATGNYSNANVAAFLPTYGGTVLANLINFTNNSGVIEQGQDRITITGNAEQVNTGAYFNDTGEAAIFANSYVAIATNTTGNINPTWTFDQLGNLSAPGNITAVGNITGNYILGNGSQLTGLPATYGNSNVTTLLASFGSNSISTTGNITSAYVIGNGSLLSGITGANVSGSVAQANYANTANSVAGGNVTGQVANALVAGTVYTAAQPNITSVGTLTSLSSSGNITGNYFIGNGSQLTGLTTSAGGSNTQIQYNNGNAFAGNAAMTFNNTTGNIGLGNIIINTNQIETVAVANLAAVTAGGQTTPWRILVGDAYNGNTNSAYSATSPGTIQSPLNASRMLVADFVTLSNNGMRFAEQTNYIWANLSANIANTGTRFGIQRNEMVIGGGTSAFGITATNTPTVIVGSTTLVTLGAGTNANLSLVGNITTSAGATALISQVTVNNYSTANLIVGGSIQCTTNNANTTAFGNATTQLGLVTGFSGAPANANITGTTTAVAYYMPGATQIIPGFSNLNGNIARQATNYYSFRSDDTLAKAQLGSLSSFNEYTGNITSSGGSLVVDKSVAQVQQVYLTEAITAITFSNFVTRVQKPNATFANQSDTVTLIVQQGATPYAVAMPSGTAYRYAGGANTVGSTANTTTMISITGTYNYNTSADQYLITISPAFS